MTQQEKRKRNRLGVTLISVVALALFVALNTSGMQAQPTPATPNLIDTSIKSSLMSEDRRVIIHLPHKYEEDTNRRYPVMYVLDGTSQDQHTADKVEVLSDAGLIPAVITVGLPNTRGNRERDQTPPFMRTNVDDANSPYGRANTFLEFIEKELVPYVEARYRTTGYRMITGNSRGGLFVIYTLLEKPDLFHARFCYSTPVWRFSDLIVNKTGEFLQRRVVPRQDSFT